MKTVHRLISIPLFSLLAAACAPAGYYDSSGEYRSYGKSDSVRHDSAMSGTLSSSPPEQQTMVQPATTVIYEQPGYYDYQGAYVESEDGPIVPGKMFPPRGKCRIWFEDRPAREQPPIESCVGIHERVPEGAYVVYGG